MRGCGCFDGRYPVEVDEWGRESGGELVALRCPQHRKVPAQVAGLTVTLVEDVRLPEYVPPPRPERPSRPPRPVPPTTRSRTKRGRTRRRRR
jgi:hypothetical protein